jgi:anaerobic ribonucleoside-triphosphate reductase activating protein
MKVAEIKYCDIANGVGVRTTLFVAGCRRHCPGCFNPEAWELTAGEPFTPEVEERILASLAPDYIAGLTLLGGEPFEPENQRGLVDFVERVRAAYPHKSIWSYSGFCFEELVGSEPVRAPYATPVRTEVTDRLLACIDVLVDGPFVLEEKDISLRFRGSRNQRLLDLPASLAADHPIPWTDDPLFAAHSLFER